MKGQTMIETVVGLSAAIIVVSAISVAVITALGNVEFSKSQTLATQYAQEAIEIVQRLRNANFQNFWSKGGTVGNGTQWCLDKGSFTLTAPSSGTCGLNVDNIFIRQVFLRKIADDTEKCPKNTMMVTTQVCWQDSKCPQTPYKCGKQGFCHSSQLISCLSDYTVVPTP